MVKNRHRLDFDAITAPQLKMQTYHNAAKLRTKKSV